MADSRIFRDNRSLEIIRQENNQYLRDIIRNICGRNYKKHKVLMIGQSGSGKSSVINTLLRFVIKRRILRARPGAGRVQSKTLELKWFAECATIDDDFLNVERKDDLENLLRDGNESIDAADEKLVKEIFFSCRTKLPDLFDAAGMQNKNDEATKEILRLLIGGYISPDISIVALEALQDQRGLGYLPSYYRTPDDKYKISLILFACSCDSPIPYNLIKCLQEVLGEVDDYTLRKRYESDVYLLITKFDKVTDVGIIRDTDNGDSIEVLQTECTDDGPKEILTMSEFRNVRRDLAEAFAIRGVADDLSSHWVSYSEDVNQESPYVDNLALKLLCYMTTPLHVPNIQTSENRFKAWLKGVFVGILHSARCMARRNVQMNISNILLLGIVLFGILAILGWFLMNNLNLEDVRKSKHQANNLNST